MKAAPRLALVALVASAPLALHAAEVASTNLSVTATVLDICVVSAPTGLVFASVNTGTGQCTANFGFTAQTGALQMIEGVRCQ